MPGEIVEAAGAAATAVYVLKQLFGPSLDAIGKDIDRQRAIGWQKIVDRATAKTPSLEDGKAANLRVARDVLWNGAFTDDEICAEYFGGILAACRSEDGNDDSAMQFVDCIKGMSSKQLHLHYVIYRSLQNMLIGDGKQINPGQEAELLAVPICFQTVELMQLGINPPVDLTVLHRQGLIRSWQTASQQHADGKHGIHFCTVTATTFGVILYAIAMNRLSDWANLTVAAFEGNDAIQTPKHYAYNPGKLLELMMARAQSLQDSDERGG